MPVFLNKKLFFENKLHKKILNKNEKFKTKSKSFKNYLKVKV